MLPLSTLNNCGSSSRLYFLTNFAPLINLGSLSSLKSGPDLLFLLEREKKVISKLKLFSTVTSKDLVASVYDDVDSKLHPIAIWSLEAHLYKLLEDGMVEYNSTDKIWSFT